MKHSRHFKKLVVALSLVGACAGVGATTTPLGPIMVGATPFSGVVPAAGLFQDIFTFTAPANGGSGYSVLNFPLTIPNFGNFNTIFSSLALFSNVDGMLFNADDTLLTSTASNANSLSLNWAPTTGGNFYILVGGLANGSLGGLYSGAISISPIPEPETYGLFLAGLGLLGTIIARRRKA